MTGRSAQRASRPTGRGIGWGLDITDWDESEGSDNVVIYNAEPEVNNSFGISLSGWCRNARIVGDVVYGQNETTTNPWACSLTVAAGAEEIASKSATRCSRSRVIRSSSRI